MEAGDGDDPRSGKVMSRFGPRGRNPSTRRLQHRDVYERMPRID